jgi:hypothetical protein
MFNGLSNEAQQLISNLEIPPVTDTPSSQKFITNIFDTLDSKLSPQDKEILYNLVDKQMINKFVPDNNLADTSTSPFISSEMYNYLMKSNSQANTLSNTSDFLFSLQEPNSQKPNILKGGKPPIKKNNIKKMKNHTAVDNDKDDLSSTTTTTSTTTLSQDDDLFGDEDEIKETEQVIQPKTSKHPKKIKNQARKLTETDLSYLSSSAHEPAYKTKETSSSKEYYETPKINRYNKEENRGKNLKGLKNNETNTSVEKDNFSESISVNTEEIDMISDY